MLFGKFVAGNMLIAVIYTECKKEVQGEIIATKLPPERRCELWNWNNS